MRRPALQWTLAVVITLVSAIWQRVSGPTYPVKGAVQVGTTTIQLKLERSHEITERQPVKVPVQDPAVTGAVEWRRFPSSDAWQREPLARQGDVLQAFIPPEPQPLMPAAGKLEFQVHLAKGDAQVAFPERPAITRFKGPVSAWVLIPHVSAMFFGMLFSTRAALAALFGGDTRRWGRLTVLLLVVGGFILGPIVQKLAFGAYWTGIPWGWDLTDNKTLFAGVAWLAAAWQMRNGRAGRAAAIAAAVITLVVFAIPHSVWGSEVKWGR
jgi:hypothetical protein